MLIIILSTLVEYDIYFGVMRLNLKKFNIFYGWWIVGGGLLLGLYVGGVVTYSFTAFFEPIANEFTWSYTQISIVASLRGIEAGILAPVFGFLVDRWGPRRLIFGGSVIIGSGLLILSRINSLGMFYFAFILISIGMSACTGTVVMTAIANWFSKKVATAAGIVASGLGWGGLLLPFITMWIDTFGWRKVVVGMGLTMWIIGLPLSLLFRHKPEQYGFLPDGDTGNNKDKDQKSSSIQTGERKASAKLILKSHTFWHIALSLMCQVLVISTVQIHIMPYLSSIGISRSVAGLAAGALPVISILGRLGFGWLGDSFNKRWTMAIGFTLTSLGLLAFNYVNSVGIWLLIPCLIFFSIGWGGMITMRTAILAEYFGRDRFGTILGSVDSITMIGSITGAPVVGWVFDKWGSYQYAWLALFGIAALSVIIIITTPAFRMISQKVNSQDN